MGPQLIISGKVCLPLQLSMFVTADLQYVTLDQCRFQTRVASDWYCFLRFFRFWLITLYITLICRIRLMSLQKFRHLPLPTFARCSGEDFTYLKIAKCLGKRMKMVMWVFCRELLHAKNIVLKILRENYPNLVFWLKFEPCFHGQKNALQWGLQWNSINWHLGLP